MLIIMRTSFQLENIGNGCSVLLVIIFSGSLLVLGSIGKEFEFFFENLSFFVLIFWVLSYKIFYFCDCCSTKGMGNTEPNPKGVKILPDGVAVPMGKPVEKGGDRVSGFRKILV